MSWNFPADLDSIKAALSRIEAKVATYSDELAAIKQAIDAMQARVTADLNDLKTKIGNGTVSAADQAVVDSILAEVNALDAPPPAGT